MGYNYNRYPLNQKYKLSMVELSGKQMNTLYQRAENVGVKVNDYANALVQGLLDYKDSKNEPYFNIASFIDEHLVMDSLARSSLLEAYDNYKIWCYRNSTAPTSTLAFVHALTSSGFTYVMIKGSKKYQFRYEPLNQVALRESQAGEEDDEEL